MPNSASLGCMAFQACSRAARSSPRPMKTTSRSGGRGTASSRARASVFWRSGVPWASQCSRGAAAHPRPTGSWVAVLPAGESPTTQAGRLASQIARHDEPLEHRSAHAPAPKSVSMPTRPSGMPAAAPITQRKPVATELHLASVQSAGSPVQRAPSDSLPSSQPSTLLLTSSAKDPRRARPDAARIGRTASRTEGRRNRMTLADTISAREVCHLPAARSNGIVGSSRDRRLPDISTPCQRPGGVYVRRTRPDGSSDGRARVARALFWRPSAGTSCSR